MGGLDAAVRERSVWQIGMEIFVVVVLRCLVQIAGEFLFYLKA